MVLSDHVYTELDTLLRTAVARREVPGLVALVANHQEVIYRGAFGVLDEQSGKAMSVNAIFRILSMTKPVTSVAIMLLCEQGRLGLDDAVGRYLPDLANRQVLDTFAAVDGSYTSRPALREVTVRDLLTHTAGFGYDFSNHTLRALCQGGKRSPRKLPLLHDPGEQWTYGMSTSVLGEIIEQVTGEPLETFFGSQIFQPLGMSNTGFRLKAGDRERLASLARRINGELVSKPEAEAYVPYVAGDAGLLSTADDYARFLQMLLNRGQFGNSRLLTEHSVKELTRNQIGNLKVQQHPGAIPNLSNPFPLGAGEDTFSLAFQLKEGDSKHGRSRGSYSWAGLYNTHFWVDPQKGVAAVLLMQLLPFYDDLCIRLLTNFEHEIYRNLR